MINIKHGHCLLIHGSSVFCGYILDSPLPRLVQYVPKNTDLLLVLSPCFVILLFLSCTDFPNLCKVQIWIQDSDFSLNFGPHPLKCPKTWKNAINFFWVHWPYNTCNPIAKRSRQIKKINEITSHFGPKMHF